MTAHAHETCTEADIDAIRFEVARVDMMASVAMEHFDRTVWHEVDDARVDFVAHLIAATTEAASTAPRARIAPALRVCTEEESHQ